jgi:hypothetical protein
MQYTKRDTFSVLRPYRPDLNPYCWRSNRYVLRLYITQRETRGPRNMYRPIQTSNSSFGFVACQLWLAVHDTSRSL